MITSEIGNNPVAGQANPRDASKEGLRTMKILITGANGLIGSFLAERLPALGEYELSGLDIVRNPSPSFASFTEADCNDYDAIAPAFEGIDGVVHLAANAPVSTPWPDVLRNNIASTHNVYEAARNAGVKRLVFASSNHAVGNFEMDEPYASIVRGDYTAVDEDPSEIPEVNRFVPVRPDSDYGVSKVFGEATGRYYSEHFGMEVACLRIGTVNRENAPTDIRSLATWLSHRDLTQLVHLCLTRQLRFEIFYGVSDNRWRFWAIEHAREVLGYLPQDDAEDYRYRIAP